MAASYRYVVTNNRTGERLGELAFTDVTFSEVLNGYGTFTGTLSLDHPQAHSLLVTGKHEINVLRNDATVVFNGPITRVNASLNDRKVRVTASSFYWYFTRRVFQYTKKYRRDQFNIVRDMLAGAIGRPGSGGGLLDGKGLFPNFAVDSHLSGVEKVYNVSAKDLRLASDIMDDLSGDPVTGFDFRFDYNIITGGEIERKLRLGYPFLGGDRTSFTIEPNNGLIDLTLDEEIDRAANVVHTLGGGAGTTIKTGIAINQTSLNAGYQLFEEVINRSDIDNQKIIDAQGKEAMRALIPPLRSYVATYRPTAALPWNFADLGDKIKISVPFGFFQDAPQIRRVVEIEIQVDDEGEERISLVTDNPADTVT